MKIKIAWTSLLVFVLALGLGFLPGCKEDDDKDRQTSSNESFEYPQAGAWMVKCLTAGDEGLSGQGPSDGGTELSTDTTIYQEDYGWFNLKIVMGSEGMSTCQQLTSSTGKNSCAENYFGETWGRDHEVWMIYQDRRVKVMPNLPSFHGTINPAENLIAATMVDVLQMMPFVPVNEVEPNDAALHGFYDSNNLCAIVKMGGASFYVSDLAGTWMTHTLTAGDAPSWLGWRNMKSTFDNAGNETCQQFLDSDGATSCAGMNQTTWAVATDGTATLSSDVSLEGLMALGKNTMVVTRDDAGGAANFSIMTKMSGSGFSTADMQGSWMTHTLVSGDAPDWMGWSFNEMTVDAAGLSTCVKYYDATGDDSCATRDGWTWTVAADGTVTRADLASLHGVMDPGKNMITLTYTDGGGGFAMAILSRL